MERGVVVRASWGPLALVWPCALGAKSPSLLIAVRSAAAGTRRFTPPPQKVPQQVVDVGRNDCWRLVLCSSRRLFHWFARNRRGSWNGRRAGKRRWICGFLLHFMVCFFSLCVVVLLNFWMVVLPPSLYGLCCSLYGLWLCLIEIDGAEALGNVEVGEATESQRWELTCSG